MSYIVHAILVFDPSDMTMTGKHALATINRKTERNDLGIFEKVGRLSWGGNRYPQGTEIFLAAFNGLNQDWITRLVERVSRCIPGKTQLLLQDAEMEGALFEQVFPRGEPSNKE